jgi:hypothetical protein
VNVRGNGEGEQEMVAWITVEIERVMKEIGDMKVEILSQNKCKKEEMIGNKVAMVKEGITTQRVGI